MGGVAAMVEKLDALACTRAMPSLGKEASSETSSSSSVRVRLVAPLPFSPSLLVALLLPEHSLAF